MAEEREISRKNLKGLIEQGKGAEMRSSAIPIPSTGAICTMITLGNRDDFCSAGALTRCYLAPPGLSQPEGMFPIEIMGRPVEKIPAFDMQSMPRAWDFDQLRIGKPSRKIGCIGRRHQDVLRTGNDERRRRDVAQGVCAVE